MNSRWLSSWKLLVLTAGVMVSAPAAAQTAADSSVTFSKDIAPILQRACQRCHRPDSVAPMSLLTYAEARPYARAMKQRTALRDAPWGRGAMPPWFLEKNIGIQKFKGDFSLTDEEIATFAAWADNGAPEGNRADLPPPLKFAGAAEWQYGKPDLIVASPQFLVPELASDNAVGVGLTPTGLREDRYISQLEFKEVTRYTSGKKPTANAYGGLYVIHHGGVSIGQADDDSSVGDSDAKEGDDGESGRPALSLHEVGRNGEIFPPDAGKLLPGPRSALFFHNLHVHASGAPGSERIARLDVGLWLHPRGYTPKYKPVSASFRRREMQVNPLQANQKIDAYLVLDKPARLLNYEPHMHASGVRMCLEIIVGQNIPETINCSGYDHNWVRNYIYDENSAPLMPAGTIMHLMGWMDNTAKNENILDPRNLSRWGSSSVSNMFIMFGERIDLTEEQYQQEVAKRREYYRLTGEEIIGCPDCWAPPPAPTTTATGSR